MSGCDDCTRKFQGDVRMAPMLHDRSWCQLAPEDKTLCSDCMFKRADAKGIKLTLADLLPCPFNLGRGPFSWFERFAKDESAPPNNLAEWLDESPSLSPRLMRWLRAGHTFKRSTTTEQTVLGVDPGIRGGLAIIAVDANGAPRLIDAIDIPVAGVEAKERVNVLAIRDWIITQHAPAHAFIERAQAMPKQGASSGFKYGRSVGSIEAAISLCAVPLTIIEVTAWKKFHQLRGGDKEGGRQRALQLFPAAHEYLARKKDHGRGEAALIALYGARLFQEHPGSDRLEITHQQPSLSVEQSKNATVNREIPAPAGIAAGRIPASSEATK
jgi:crossover junction endodeoxyribonuclease RuvC